MLHIARRAAMAALALLALVTLPAGADDKPYKEGTIWVVSLIKVKPGMEDVYLKDVLPMRKKIDVEAMKEGLLISSHVLSGDSANPGDWNIMFLDEYKNYAAFDGLSDKYDAIMAKTIGNDAKQTQVMVKRSDVREIFGDKVMQELIIK